jgi:hypothetical protein
LEVAAETSLFAERVAFFGGGNRTIEVDEFRVGTTWADNVYVTPSSFGLTLERSNDFVSWDQVSFTPDMVTGDGRIVASDLEGSNFFRLRIEPKEEIQTASTSPGNVYEVGSSFDLTLEQSSELAAWNQVLITSEMIGADGRIFPPDVEGKNFFRMRIEADNQ